MCGKIKAFLLINRDECGNKIDRERKFSYFCRMIALHLPPLWQHLAYQSVPSTMQCCNFQRVEPGHFLLVTAEEQTAGRGQRGTVWESAAGENLTFSMAWRDVGVAARDQFLLSEILALAVAETVAGQLQRAGCGAEVSVKWPNDVYVGDRKICGMLIEHSIVGGRIDGSMAGIGINVNQNAFVGDAPNPVSLRQLTGKLHGRAEVLEEFVVHFARGVAMLQQQRYAEVEAAFAARLYRRSGWHLFRDAGGMFRGRFVGIARNGLLTLQKTTGQLCTYAFKEVAFVVPPSRE